MARRKRKPRFVLDSSALRSVRTEDLQAFVKGRRFVITQALLYETLTHEEVESDSWKQLILKLKNMPFCVAKLPYNICQEEMKAGTPTVDFIHPDYTVWLKQQLELNPARWPRALEIVDSHRRDSDRRTIVSRRRTRLAELRREEFQEEVRDVQRLSVKNGWSLAYAFRVTTQQITKSAWQENYRFLPRLATRKSFAFMEVWLANYYDYRRSLAQGNAVDSVSDKTLFNEEIDREYVLMLAGAEGLISADKQMLETAEAFFPNRMVIDASKIRR